jgi:hypothetical protein
MKGRTTQKPVKSVTGAPYSFVGIIGHPTPKEGMHTHHCDACDNVVYLDDDAWGIRLAGLPTLCIVCLNVLMFRRKDG